MAPPTAPVLRKPAEAEHPIHALIGERWSPRAFADRPVAQGTLHSVLEAARWGLRTRPGSEPLAVIALGYPGDHEALPKDLREREVALRSRKAQREFVFAGRWGEPLVAAS